MVGGALRYCESSCFVKLIFRLVEVGALPGHLKISVQFLVVDRNRTWNSRELGGSIGRGHGVTHGHAGVIPADLLVAT